jgi:DNA-binding LacI/PurR family transcriptional regulator/DNA-binding transcriptional regulator YhcF (GntR family)
MPLLYERLRAHLLDEIRSGRLGVGDRIPSELALAEQFNVSRITSKKALETLERDGVIVRFRGKGSFVADTRPTADGVRRQAIASGGPRLLPDALASQTVGFVFPDLSDVFGVRMFDGIEEQAAAHGLQLVVRRSRGHREIEMDAITRLVGAGVRGLIVFPIHGEYYNDELLRIVIDGFPVVLVDRYMKGIAVSSVGTNNVEAARALVDCLVEQGRRNLAFISPPPERTSSIEDRRRGFGAGLRAHRLGVDQANLLLTLSSTLPGEDQPTAMIKDIERINAFLDANPDRDGFVAVEYTLALLMQRVLEDRGQHDLVPYVTCFDSPGNLIEPVRFTHVRQDEFAIGTTAVDTLVGQMAKPTAATRTDIPFTIVEAGTRS